MIMHRNTSPLNKQRRMIRQKKLSLGIKDEQAQNYE